ncbi:MULTISPECIES: PolC-type DNA polymerase III [Bacillaceae]|uniref:3'-5' exoribonuclease n=1 Tax=Evansella alkalicola TaxID=745819 RepID=A0ABS6JS76_9BACI|nr:MULTISPECIES: exonuclease domain-containing protein [Bacillaceae]MBU9721418.1 3'-5' exoribonuclease [Bacillus alkalicola]
MTISLLKVLKYFLLEYHQKKNERLRWKKENKDIQQEVITKFGQQKAMEDLENTPLDELTFTVFDLETTGFYPLIGDEIISIGAKKINMKKVKYPEHYYEVIQSLEPPSSEIVKLTGIDYETWKKGASFPQVFSKFLSFSLGTVLVAHPASFDVHFLKVEAERWGFKGYAPKYIDSYEMAQVLSYEGLNLDELIKKFNIQKRNRHHALDDAEMTAMLFQKFVFELKKHGIHTYSDWKKATKSMKQRRTLF